MSPLSAASVSGGHLLLATHHLVDTMQAARAAGFCVVPGTRGATPRNAMIHLASNWFLELVDPRVPRLLQPLLPVLQRLSPATGARVRAWHAAGDGVLCDWSVDVSDLVAARAAAIGRGVDVGAARGFSRVQHTGVRTRWKLAVPHDTRLPFLKSPYADHADVSEQRLHPNGARTLKAFSVVCPAPADVARRLEALFGVTVANDVLRLGDVEVQVRAGPITAIADVVLGAEVQAHQSVQIGALRLGLAPQ